MAPKAVQAKRQKESKEKPRSKARKLKKNSWNEDQTFIFAIVLSRLERRDKLWALVLETLALKKSANERVFRKILEKFEDSVAKKGKYVKDENYMFTADQLRAKYNWFKQE